MINCPYCGAGIQTEDARHNIWQCKHCSHALLLEAQPVIQPIQSSSDDTALITLGASFIWRDQRYTTHGFLNLTHREGIRTEWQVKTDGGDDFLLMTDDENFFLLQPIIGPTDALPSWDALQPNTHLSYANKDWLVTEQRRMTLASSHSDTRDAVTKQTRDETYLIADNAETLMLLFTDKTIAVRQGFWLDPFEIEVCS